MAKHIVKFGTTTNTAGETISEINDGNMNSPLSDDRSRYSMANVIIDVKTLTGTSPTITVSVQENFCGIYAETAKSAAISSTGKYILCRHVAPNATVTGNSGAFPALGSGADKQIVTTTGGTVSAVTADIYFDFYS